MRFVFITIYLITVLYIWIKMYFTVNYVGDEKKYNVSLKNIIKNHIRLWAYVPIFNTILLVWAEIEEYNDVKNYDRRTKIDK